MGPMAEPGKLWTVKMLAKAAGVNGSTVRRALIDGKIRGEKLGNMWLIPDAAARAWLEKEGRSETD